MGDRKAKAVIPGKLKSAAREVTAPPVALNLDPFYRQYTTVGRYPIVSSDKVSKYALQEAA